MWGSPAATEFDSTWLGYAALGLGLIAGLASAFIVIRTRADRSGTTQRTVAADVRATIDRLAEPAPAAVPADLAEWEQHAAQVARHQLDLYLQHSQAALRQAATSFRIGMTAASLGFLAVLGSLAWLLTTRQDVAWLGVISGALCEAVAGLFFHEVRSTRASSNALRDRVQAEADRVVRARGAMSVVQGISDPTIRETLLADIGRWLLGADPALGQQRADPALIDGGGYEREP